MNSPHLSFFWLLHEKTTGGNFWNLTGTKSVLKKSKYPLQKFQLEASETGHGKPMDNMAVSAAIFLIQSMEYPENVSLIVKICLHFHRFSFFPPVLTFCQQLLYVSFY